MRYAAARAKASSLSYHWMPAGKPVSVQLNLSIVDAITADVMAGFWAVPRRGAEVGGILLGRTAEGGGHTTVFIEDYEPVECEHRLGPSYSFSDADRQALERALSELHASAKKRQRKVVGFYRSHTRDGLGLAEDDLSMASEYFSEPDNVILLIKPSATKPPVAGFFIWEESGVQADSSYLEFPFSTAELVRVEQPVIPATASAEPVAAAPEPPPPVRAASVPAAIAASPPAVRPRTLASLFERHRAGALAAASVVFIGAAWFQYRTASSMWGELDLLSGSSSLPELRVERQGDALRVQWNRTSPAVKRAQHGRIAITDGAYDRVLDLDSTQLQTGSVAYVPTSSDVNFRLELMNAGQTVSESVRFVDSRYARIKPLPAAEKSETVSVPKPVKSPSVRPSPAPVKKAKAAARPKAGEKIAARRVPRKYLDDGL